MSALPAGTVTFVFTDIEGSTALLKRLGDGYGEVLAQHRRLVRATFASAGGSEIDTQGDAFFYAFPRAREAVSAAVAVQRAHADAEWPAGAVVRLRIGLHTGEPAVGEEGYLGLDVVRAARICTVGRGGQVLISEATRALVGSSLPEGVSVFPLGERQLKGIDEPERVYELEIEGLQPAAPDAESGPMAAPAPPEAAPRRSDRDFEQRFEDFGQRLAAGIQDRVLRSLESKLEKMTAPSVPEGEDDHVDDIAARAESFEGRIRERVEASLRRSGTQDEPKS